MHLLTQPVAGILTAGVLLGLLPPNSV